MLKKKSKPRVTNIICTLPKNLVEEEKKFFASGYSINPQFEYEYPIATKKYLE